ncbi:MULTISPECIES: alpha/beta fold hydrolase [unclassified Herbaspirillum]|uniref:alpha/beta fold hydrolase n=1 Tax=unclassified Herbaspirillum TaxID=2624150 RepID=UPI001150EC5D|nr:MULTISPECIES: alpha/beta fold hydrolase [unclassified Herbaspirillum]MBB5393813.1 pimeloyl-ACP methyl ester carboxylesterase [Herbaspirillum sp. SJZ102]TQK01329.1 pimeloyl-ACP methyl ester carboxylesterase [Herbaspirillum sp. SJZ130]TQK05725.1 pimeloyl-ACP methyl ester carboxylesterase [Herbaspirillum sp. SJZ106]TWC63248.1 pimeloyl-ACP methyl ester carboxylesterase [Herbaspirillum sp. SJZ099]
MMPIFRTLDAERLALARYRDLLDEWPVPHTRRMVPSGIGETFVLSCGPSDGPPLVLLHGAQANAASWLADAATWARHFRVHILDMPGQPGLSAPSRLVSISRAALCWLDDVMDGLGLVNASFAGISLGGWMALNYAVSRPGRVAQLVLISPAGIGRQRAFLLKAWPCLMLGQWGLRRIRRMVIGPVAGALSPFHAKLASLMEYIGLHARIQPIVLPRFSDAALGSLAMPVMAVLGGKDVLLDSAHTRARLERCVPHACIHWRPEAFHFITREAETIQAFLLAPDARGTP